MELAVQHRAKIEIFHAVSLESLKSDEVQKALDDYMARVEKEVFDNLASRSDAIKTRGLAVETVVLRRLYPIAAILETDCGVRAGLSSSWALTAGQDSRSFSWEASPRGSSSRPRVQ